MPRSRRSLATCPVARTLYWACSTRPSASMTNVDRITPVDRLAVQLLLAVGAVRRQHRLVRVGQQREGQVVAARGTCASLSGVSGDRPTT